MLTAQFDAIGILHFDGPARITRVIRTLFKPFNLDTTTAEPADQRRIDAFTGEQGPFWSSYAVHLIDLMPHDWITSLADDEQSSDILEAIGQRFGADLQHFANEANLDGNVNIVEAVKLAFLLQDGHNLSGLSIKGIPVPAMHRNLLPTHGLRSDLTIAQELPTRNWKRTVYVDTDVSNRGDCRLYARLAVTPAFMRSLHVFRTLCWTQHLSELRVAQEPGYWGPGNGALDYALSNCTLAVTPEAFYLTADGRHPHDIVKTIPVSIDWLVTNAYGGGEDLYRLDPNDIDDVIPAQG